MAQVVLERDEAEQGDLPEVCMICGRRATAFPIRRYTWQPTWAAGTGVAGLVGLAIRTAVTRRMTVVVPLCGSHTGWMPWRGIRPARITAESITLKNVCEAFIEALEDYREGRQPQRHGDDRHPRRSDGRRSAKGVPAARSSSSVWIWVLLGACLLPVVVCGGLIALALRWQRQRPSVLPPGPNTNPAAVVPAELRPEPIAALAVCPHAGFPGNLPWAALLLSIRPDLPRPLSDKDLDRILADLKSGNVFSSSEAANRLAKAMPNEQRRPEVARALEGLLQSPFPNVREAGARALVVWGTPENGPALLALLDSDPFPGGRGAAMAALAALKDARAAGPIARRLSDLPSRAQARQALEILGQPAEKAVLPYLSHPDGEVRIEACHVLAAIGGKNSVAALQAAAQDRDRGVAQAAQQALAAIAARPGR